MSDSDKDEDWLSLMGRQIMRFRCVRITVRIAPNNVIIGAITTSNLEGYCCWCARRLLDSQAHR